MPPRLLDMPVAGYRLQAKAIQIGKLIRKLSRMLEQYCGVIGTVLSIDSTPAAGMPLNTSGDAELQFDML